MLHVSGADVSIAGQKLVDAPSEEADVGSKRGR
jgi:hypothetical protein